MCFNLAKVSLNVFSILNIIPWDHCAGLVNGAEGKIHKIVYSPNRKPPALPDMILVEVPQYLGKSCIDKENVVPIVPITRTWIKNKVTCSRKALPLVPSYAITIHKSQGASMDNVVLDLSDQEFAIGLAYTALSRCKTLENLYFYEKPPIKTRLTNHFKRHLFKKKLEEDVR